MKLSTFLHKDTVHIGLVALDGMISISDRLEKPPGSMIHLIQDFDQFRSRLENLLGTPAEIDISDVKFMAPVPRPGKILGIGMNYRDHISEVAGTVPQEQIWFSKAVTSVSAPYGHIELPKVSSALDYEGELVMVMGTTARSVSHAEAANSIFGYCVGNDVSVRDWQMRTSQFTLGKSFDTHAPFGPWIVTADEADPQNLMLKTFVNGDLRQQSSTSAMIFSIYDQVSHLSKVMTLEAGDVVFTGTPSGVAAAMKPPRWLQVGDNVRVEIDGLGAIENTVTEEGTRGFAPS